MTREKENRKWEEEEEEKEGSEIENVEKKGITSFAKSPILMTQYSVKEDSVIVEEFVFRCEEMLLFVVWFSVSLSWTHNFAKAFSMMFALFFSSRFYFPLFFLVLGS